MRVITLVLLALLLSGCSSQFAYRNLDWVIIWYANDYLDLDRPQQAQLGEALESVLQWHETTQLPKYRDHLQTFSDDLALLSIQKKSTDQLAKNNTKNKTGAPRLNTQTTALSQAYIAQQFEQIFSHWHTLKQHMSQQIPPLVVQLRQDQIALLFNKLNKRNQTQQQEQTELSPQERIEKRNEKIQDFVIDLLGSVNDQQRTLITQLAKTLPNSSHLRIAYLSEYQGQLKQAMQAPIDKTALQHLLDNPDDVKTDEYQKQQRENQTHITLFAHNMSQHLQKNQIQHLQEKLDEYIEMIDEILKKKS